MSKYSHQKVDVSNENVSLTKIVNMIDDGAEILDIGCSSGYLAEYLIQQKNCQVSGIELSKEDAEIAKKVCKKVVIANVEDSIWEKEFEKNSFDYIIVADLLEHLKNPLELLKRLKSYIKPKGFIIVSIPNIAHVSIRLELLRGDFESEERGILDDTHLQYFTLKKFSNLIKKADLFVNELHYTTFDFPTKYLNEELEKLGLKTTSAFINLITKKESIAYQYIFKISAEKTKGISDLPQNKKPMLEVHQLVENQTRIIEEKEELVQKLLKEAEAKQKHIENLQKETSQIPDLVKTIDEKNEHIENFQKELSEKNQHIENFQKELKEKNQHIENFQKELKEKNQHIENFQKELEEKNQHIENFQNAVAHLDGEINNQRKTIEILENKVFNVNALKNKVKKLISKTSSRQ